MAKFHIVAKMLSLTQLSSFCYFNFKDYPFYAQTVVREYRLSIILIISPLWLVEKIQQSFNETVYATYFLLAVIVGFSHSLYNQAQEAICSIICLTKSRYSSDDICSDVLRFRTRINKIGISAAMVIIDATKKSSHTALINACVHTCDTINAEARIAATD